MSSILCKFQEINHFIKKKLFRLSIILFAFFLLSAIVSYFVVKLLPIEQIEKIVELLRQMYNADNMADKEGFSLFGSLFIHNLKACGVMVASGITPFLFVPLYFLFSNGIVCGAVFGIGGYMGVENLFFVFLKFFLPHAIFEIPVIILSAAMGIRLCYVITKKIIGKAKSERFMIYFENYVDILWMYIIPLLLMVAFLEGDVEHIVFGL